MIAVEFEFESDRSQRQLREVGQPKWKPRVAGPKSCVLIHQQLGWPWLSCCIIMHVLVALEPTGQLLIPP